MENRTTLKDYVHLVPKLMAVGIIYLLTPKSAGHGAMVVAAMAVMLVWLFEEAIKTFVGFVNSQKEEQE